jgi:hypothetical protein
MERRGAFVATGLLAATAGAAQVIAGFAARLNLVQILFLIVTAVAGVAAASLGVLDSLGNPSKEPRAM